MKKYSLKITMVMATVVATLIGVVNSLSAYAQTSITVSPMKQSVMLVPGETYSGSIEISNPADSTGNVNYVVDVAPYSVKSAEGGEDDYGSFDIEEKTAMNQIVDWITIENETGVVAPNHSMTVRFTIEVPEDAPAGGQYAAFLVRNNDGADETGEGDMAVKEIYQMTSKIYAEVMGETIEKGQVLENNVPAFVLNNEIAVSSMVENQGNTHTDAEYILQVWPMGSDEEICTNEESVDTSLVLPGTKKLYRAACALPSVGIYKVKQTVRIFGEESIVEKIVVYCPIWMMLLILFGVALIVIWLVMSARGRRK